MVIVVFLCGWDGLQVKLLGRRNVFNGPGASFFDLRDLNWTGSRSRLLLRIRLNGLQRVNCSWLAIAQVASSRGAANPGSVD